jgi:hypothetical protein
VTIGLWGRECVFRSFVTDGAPARVHISTSPVSPQRNGSTAPARRRRPKASMRHPGSRRRTAPPRGKCVQPFHGAQVTRTWSLHRCFVEDDPKLPLWTSACRMTLVSPRDWIVRSVGASSSDFDSRSSFSLEYAAGSSTQSPGNKHRHGHLCQ